MTDAPKRTKARHRLLAEVAADTRSIYEGLQWTVIHRDGRWCKTAEARTSRELRSFIRSRGKPYGSNIAEAELGPTGVSLLAEWNAKYGDPLAPTTPGRGGRDR